MNMSTKHTHKTNPNPKKIQTSACGFYVKKVYVMWVFGQKKYVDAMHKHVQHRAAAKSLD
jgi:hypothetical protein